MKSSGKSIEKLHRSALFWREKHLHHVDALVASAGSGTSPAAADFKKPESWTGGHWKWFYEVKGLRVGVPQAGLLPTLDALSHEVFRLVEEDQGKGFVPESTGDQHRNHAQFFDRVRACEKFSRNSANKLRAFLKKYGQDTA